jgi:hypothetical protein
MGHSRSQIHFKVRLEAHADEIGFMVKAVTKEGYLHVDRIGGSDTTARGRKFIFRCGFAGQDRRKTESSKPTSHGQC